MDHEVLPYMGVHSQFKSPGFDYNKREKHSHMSEGILSIPQCLDSAMPFYDWNFTTYCLSVSKVDNTE